MPENSKRGGQAALPVISPHTKGCSVCFGLVRRRQAWCLSMRGWLILVTSGLGLLALIFFGIHPFLALTSRVETKILVVDGFDEEYALAASLQEFRSGHYERLVTTGGFCKGEVDLDPDDTYARMAAGILKRLGAQPDRLAVVPAAPVRRDRTYASAVALGSWLTRNYPQVKAVNVISVGPHARRTRLMYQKALGDEVAVGIIAVANREYDPQHWWRYSEGVREVVSETAAYLYARVLFRPGDNAAI